MTESQMISRTREVAFTQLKARRERAVSNGQLDNSMLLAGSPMYFYCRCCGLECDVLPENYFVSRPKAHCDACKEDIELGLLHAEEDKMDRVVPYTNR